MVNLPRLVLICFTVCFPVGCSWIASDAGTYCYCEAQVEPDGDNGCEVTLDWEYNNSSSESQKEAEIPGL